MNFIRFSPRRRKWTLPRSFFPRNKGLLRPCLKIRRGSPSSARVARYRRNHGLNSRGSVEGWWLEGNLNNTRNKELYYRPRLLSSPRLLSFPRPGRGPHSNRRERDIPRKCLMENSMGRLGKCLYILHAVEWPRERPGLDGKRKTFGSKSFIWRTHSIFAIRRG